MSRSRNKRDYREFRWLILLWFIVAAAFWLPQYAWPATSYNFPISFSGAELDSVRIIIWGNGESLTTAIYSSFPVTDTVIVWDTVDYRMIYNYWYTGESQAYIGMEWVDVKTATASISETDKKEIASYANDTITAHHGSGSYITGSGSGSNGVRIYAIDTSGTDDSVHLVQITVKTIAGVFDAARWTNTSGYYDFTLPTGSLVVYGVKSGYVWLPETLYVTTDDTVALLGYNFDPGLPASADLCRLYGWLRDIEDNAIHGAIITATRSRKENVTDTGSTPVIIGRSIATAQSDTSGYFYLDLRRTGTYSDTTKGLYDIRGFTVTGDELFKLVSFRVPDVGNVNLGDTLANRSD